MAPRQVTRQYLVKSLHPYLTLLTSNYFSTANPSSLRYLYSAIPLYLSDLLLYTLPKFTSRRKGIPEVAENVMGGYALSLKAFLGPAFGSLTLVLGFKKVANRATTQVMMKTGRLCIRAGI